MEKPFLVEFFFRLGAVLLGIGLPLYALFLIKEEK